MIEYRWSNDSKTVHLSLIKAAHEHTRDGWRDRWRYRLRWNGKLIFDNDDYSTPPGSNRDFVVTNMLAWLSLREGDTDSDFFDTYTTEQRHWSKSQDCEDVALWVYDMETKGEE